jgi:hypothetical protein
VRLTAGVGVATAGEGPIHAQVQASYTEVNSFGIDTMDHREHSFGGSLDWRPVQLFDVSLSASQTRLPVSLADIGGERSVLQTSSQAQATLRLRPVPRWQISLSPAWSETRTPLIGAEDFKLRQDSDSVSIEYLGAGKLVPGISASETRGVNSAIANPTKYRSRTYQGSLNYRASEISSISLAAGRTQRTTRLITPSNDPVALASEGTSSGFTGSLSFSRRLTAKTSINASASRGFEQYDAGVNPSVSTGFGGGVDWAPTSKISVTLGTQYTWTTIKGVRVAGTIGERKDLVRNYSLGTSYRARPRLSVITYISRRIRNSGLSYLDQYNGYSAGLALAASFD